MTYHVCALSHVKNLLPANVRTKVIEQELPEFETVVQDFLIELPVSELSSLFCVLAVHSDSDPAGASGNPCYREEKGLL